MVTAPSRSREKRTLRGRIISVSCAFVTACALALTGQPVSALAAEDPTHTIQAGQVRIFNQSSPQDITEDNSFTLNVAEGEQHYSPEETLVQLAETSQAQAASDAIPAGYSTQKSGMDLTWDTTGSQYEENMLKVAWTGPEGARVFLYATSGADSNSNAPQSILEDESGYEIDASGTWLTQNGPQSRHLDWRFTQPGEYTLAVRSLARSASGGYAAARNYVYRVSVGRAHAAAPSAASSSSSSSSSSSDSNSSSDDGGDPEPADSDSDTTPAPANAPFTGDVPSEKAPEEHPLDPQSGKELLFRTHVDAAHAYWDKVSQKLAVGVIDGSTLRPAQKVAVRLGPDADERDGREVSRIKLPSNGALNFLGKPGDILWNAPGQWYQGHHPVWPGVGAGKMPADVNPYSLTLKLTRVEGPGWVSVWRSGSDFVAQDLDSRDPQKMSMNLVAGGHGHYNWTFSKPGRYSMTWVVTGQMRDGTPLTSEEAHVDWLVGRDSDVGLPDGFTPSSDIVTPAEHFTDADNAADFGGKDDGENEDAEEPDVPQNVSCLVPGHYDLMARPNTQANDGSISMTLADDSGSERTYHSSYTAVIPVPDFAARALSDSSPSALKPLGQKGSRVWTLPEVQDPSLVWFGMNTGELDYKTILQPGVKAELSDFAGPGRMVLWDANVFDGAHTLLDTANFDRQLFFSSPTHRHLATSFSKPGIHKASYSYEVSHTPESGLRSFAYDYYDVYYAVGNAAIRKACGEEFAQKYAVKKDEQGQSAQDQAHAPAQAQTQAQSPAQSGQQGQPSPQQIADPSECRPATITREATEAEARALAARASAGSGGGASSSAPPNTARTTLTFTVGPNARGNASDGHYDLGPTIENGTLVARVKNDSAGGRWVDPQSLTFALGNRAQLTAPAALSFVASPGSTVWAISSTQVAGVPWLGMNSQRPEIVSGTRGGVTFSLESVSGPGRFAVFTSGALGGGVGTHVFDGPGSQYVLPARTHAHQNWVFTQPGTYRVTLRMSVTPTGAALQGSGFGALSGSSARSTTATAAAAGLTPTGAKGENGRPMVQQTVGQRADGTACALPGSGAGGLADTGVDVWVVALAATLLLLLGIALSWRAGRTVRAGRAVRTRRAGRPALAALTAACMMVTLAGCGGIGPEARAEADGTRQLNVVTTTGILADLARHVAGSRAKVSQLIPNGADPHSWEPSLRAIRDVAYADVAFTNYLLLEQHALIRALDANLPRSATSVSLAEEATKVGATVLPLVEDRALDTVWLGMRVAGQGAELGATRSSQIDLQVTSVKGPGQAAGYVTTTFGAPEVSFSSADGFQAADGYAKDTTVLPADAHQHMSWAFTKPGVYTIHAKARLRATPDAKPMELGEGDLVCAVGVNTAEVARSLGRQVLSEAHADLTVDLTARRLTLMADTRADGSLPVSAAQVPGAASVSSMAAFSLEDVLVDVPARTLTQVPSSANYRFIASPGSEVYMLPQAVLGKHVHGQIDPHLWHDVHNAAAYVKVIRETLVTRDPAHADEYRANAARYLSELEKLDGEVFSVVAEIPESRRQLVTTNDAYGYLAHAYGLSVAGFVTPNPATEPSLKDRKKLTATVRDLKIPAVFLEPQLARMRSVLKTVAAENGVAVCPLYGDTLDERAPTYVDMMRFNVRSLVTCLAGKAGEKGKE
ncbi:anchored repeat ABC transporter, substrate-binding protein [Alloscardovia macacae]|uniref:anchored repeat ABC transporter, substrate-binding protein n=1 Tax=Alloscardovia macacae TaxID=1160091 RepID=UPI000A2D5BA6|nr:anchored repeat ABC transporter, substrate-binding protein [Alloscardovia macacae]OTA25521.1 anchored repeat ABC transporter, substrate-binding protein [Alloscardovia macacae]